MKKTAIYLLLLLLLALEGCMMSGMHLLGTNHHSNNNQISLGKIVSKEVIVSNYKIEVEFPVSQLNQELNFVLQIHDRTTNNKITNADVWFEIISSNQNDSNDVEKLGSTKIEADDYGNFVASYTFRSEKEVQVVFIIYSVENEKFTKPIEIF